MWAYFKIECKKFFTNKKNIAVYVLLLCFAVFYAIRLAPAYDPIEKVDINAIEASYLTRETFLAEQYGKDPYNQHPAVQYALAIFPIWNQYEIDRMKALQTKDLKEYAAVTAEWYKFTDLHTFRGGYYFYNPRYYNYGNLYAHEEGHKAYMATAARYEQYAKMDNDALNLEVFEEFTAVQTIYRLMEAYLPYVLLIAALLLSVDIVLQDRKYPTLLRGYPISDWKKLLVKGVTAFVGVLAMLIPIVLFAVMIGIQFGFGSFNLPVPVAVDSIMGISYKTITMGEYFTKAALLLASLCALIISLVLFLSVLFRSEVFNLLAGLGFLASERLYYDRGNGYLYDVENFIPTYFQVSHIITNSKNSFYDTIEIAYNKGIIIACLLTGILLIVTLFISLSKRYKFIK